MLARTALSDISPNLTRHMLTAERIRLGDSRESIQSWKAHMDGAQKLLQVRGKAQFKTQTGRQLFRENRAQILIHAIWDDLECPKFLWEWDPELKRYETEGRKACRVTEHVFFELPSTLAHSEIV